MPKSRVCGELVKGVLLALHNERNINRMIARLLGMSEGFRRFNLAKYAKRAGMTRCLRMGHVNKTSEIEGFLVKRYALSD